MRPEKNFFKYQYRHPDRADASSQQSNRAENLNWSGGISRQELHRHQIEERSDDAARSILRCSGATRPKIHLQFGDMRALLCRDRGYETMHLAIEREAAR